MPGPGPLWPGSLLLLALLLAGAPVFAVLGGLALLLFWGEALPLASVPLSHYQITVNPSLPALPLFTLAGLIMAQTGAAQRLSQLFLALFGGAVRGTVVASALLCSAFTAFTGGTYFPLSFSVISFDFSKARAVISFVSSIIDRKSSHFMKNAILGNSFASVWFRFSSVLLEGFSIFSAVFEIFNGFIISFSSSDCKNASFLGFVQYWSHIIS